MCLSWLGDVEGDLVGDGDAVAFEGDDFFGVVGEDADVASGDEDGDGRSKTDGSREFAPEDLDPGDNSRSFRGSGIYDGLQLDCGLHE